MLRKNASRISMATSPHAAEDARSRTAESFPRVPHDAQPDHGTIAHRVVAKRFSVVWPASENLRISWRKWMRKALTSGFARRAAE